MSVNARLEALRSEMSRRGVDVYFVPSTDPHQSEYTPACWQRRQWASGFTGSVGDLVVTLDQAHLWTDSRYFIQAEEQLAGTGVTLERMGTPGVLSLPRWIAANVTAGAVVAADPRVLSLHVHDELEGAARAAGARLKLVSQNLVDAVWARRPSRPTSPLRRHPLRYAGESTDKKLNRLRAAMGERGVHAHVVTRLDSVAWLFNIRAEDVDFTPVAVAYALVTMDEALLFVDESKVPTEVARALSKSAELRPYDALAKELRALAKERVAVWLDAAATNALVGRSLKGARVFSAPSPVVAMKAQKNRTEIRGALAAHERDGVAMVRFLSWLDGAVRRGRLTELSAAERLEAFRAEGELYQGPSFNTISAYGSHGAIVHYGATEATDRRLQPRGIYLVDSGGQYLDGTTDITRTVLLGGRADGDQRDHFTRVLKGHIAIARVRFPAGTSGQRLDALARTALWEGGLDYGHGTGHGVGSHLAVHEGPIGIAPARALGVPLAAGHVVSNEPGYYRAGRYGIRTENLVLVVRDGALSSKERTFLRLETISLCPIDRRLIDRKMLGAEERAWLDDYHDEVRRRLGPRLKGAPLRWLERATRPL